MGLKALGKARKKKAEVRGIDKGSMTLL